MFTGKRFLIEKPTLALATGSNNEPKAITIPKGAVITVLSEPSRMGDTGRVSVEWEGRTVAMFGVDLEVRGREIKDQGAGA